MSKRLNLQHRIVVVSHGDFPSTGCFDSRQRREPTLSVTDGKEIRSHLYRRSTGKLEGFQKRYQCAFVIITQSGFVVEIAGMHTRRVFEIVGAEIVASIDYEIRAFAKLKQGPLNSFNRLFSVRIGRGFGHVLARAD